VVSLPWRALQLVPRTKSLSGRIPNISRSFPGGSSGSQQARSYLQSSAKLLRDQLRRGLQLLWTSSSLFRASRKGFPTCSGKGSEGTQAGTSLQTWPKFSGTYPEAIWGQNPKANLYLELATKFWQTKSARGKRSLLACTSQAYFVKVFWTLPEREFPLDPSYYCYKMDIFPVAQ